MSSQPGAASSSASQPVPRSKLIVRRLPPTLPEEIFWKAVSPWVTPETCLWKRYVKGSDGPVYSRAYVLMSSPEALVTFHRNFDGHIFKSKTGAEFQAVIEFAPFQKTPFKIKTKVDARQGTIEEGALSLLFLEYDLADGLDADYKSFLESLSAPASKPTLEVQVPVAQPTTTPLLEHLRATGKGQKATKKKKSKANAQGESSQSKEAAALASVSKAAANRAPKGSAEISMVAGKGRGVTITPSASTEAAAGKKKKNKKPKPTAGGSSTALSGASASTLAGASVASIQGSESGRKKPEGGNPTGNPTQESGRGKVKSGRGGRGGAAAGAGTGASQRGGAQGSSGSIRIPGFQGPTPTEGDAGKAKGRSRGRGRGGKAVTPSEARIDM